MASLTLDSHSQTTPPNPSFAIRDPTDHRHTFLFRSLSSKDDPSSTNDDNFPYNYNPSPPRLSIQLDRLPTPTLRPSTGESATETRSYRCVSTTAVVKKDGQILAMAAAAAGETNEGVELVYTGTEVGVIRVWKFPQLTECGQLKTRSRASGRVLAIHVGGDRVYGAYGDGKIRVWQRKWWDGGGGFKHVRVGTIPATGGVVRSYISAAGKDHKTSRHKGPITSLAINISEDILYSASLDKTVKVWRISELKCIETISAHSTSINSILVSAPDSLLFTASDDATVRVWRRNFCSTGARPHALVVTLPAKQSPVKTLALTSDNSILYGGCSDGYIHFWMKGWLCGQLQYGGALHGHTHAVMALACSAGTCYMVSGSADRTCRVWRSEVGGGGSSTHVCLAVLVGHHGPVRSIVVLATRSMRCGGDREVLVKEDDKGCVVCSGSFDGVLKLWRVSRDSGEKKGVAGGTNCGWVAGSGYEYFEIQQ